MIAHRSVTRHRYQFKQARTDKGACRPRTEPELNLSVDDLWEEFLATDAGSPEAGVLLSRLKSQWWRTH